MRGDQISPGASGLTVSDLIVTVVFASALQPFTPNGIHLPPPSPEGEHSEAVGTLGFSGTPRRKAEALKPHTQ